MKAKVIYFPLAPLPYAQEAVRIVGGWENKLSLMFRLYVSS